MAQELKAFGIRGEENGRLYFAEVYTKRDVDAVLAEKDAENRKLKRALYKACANWAKVTREWDESKPASDYDKWLEVERKCRAKAEEYK